VREYSPISISGFTGCLVGTMIAFGILVGYLVPLGFSDLNNPDDFYWRFVMLFAAVFGLLRTFMLLIVYRYDTPIYLISIKQSSKAKELISKIYKEEHVENMLRATI